jgi:hypothetical protein
MATMAKPIRSAPEPMRPNIATADVQLPAVRDYEQVDREITATLHPTLAWFTQRMWIETVYIFFLLAAAAAMMAAWRNGKLGPAALSGAMMGGAVLFRGVATYLPPFWVLAAVYPADGDPLTLSDYAGMTEHRDTVRVYRALDELVAGRVLLADAERYRFNQRGFIAVVNESLEPERRTALHARLAQAPTIRMGDVMRLAHHLVEGGCDRQAVELLVGLDIQAQLPPLPLLERALQASERLAMPARRRARHETRECRTRESGRGCSAFPRPTEAKRRCPSSWCSMSPTARRAHIPARRFSRTARVLHTSRPR